MKYVMIAKKALPLWLVPVLLLSGIGVGALAHYAWQSVTIPFEVKEPLQITSYTSELSLFPGETVEIEAIVQNHASINYSVQLDFQLDDIIYQQQFVIFSDEIYIVVPGEQTLKAWVSAKPSAPPISIKLTIEFKRICPDSHDGMISVSSSSSVTVYEKSDGVYIHSFPVSVVMGSGGTFSTAAQEYYTVTSDGAHLKIHCFRNDWSAPRSTGNNLVAVRLDGVPGYPEGLWATEIVDYTLGFNGIAESRFNALGPDTQIGPFLEVPGGHGLTTYLGDQHSEIVLGFADSGC